MFYQIKITEVEVPKLGFLPAIVIERSPVSLYFHNMNLNYNYLKIFSVEL